MARRVPWGPDAAPPAWAGTTDGPLARGLIAYWALREGQGTPTLDLAGGNPLTFNGNVAWTPGPERGWVASMPGAAGDYLQTAGVTFNPLDSDFTLAIWFKVNAITASVQTFATQLDGTGTGRGWLSVANTTNSGVLQSNLGTGGTSRLGTTAITVGVWHHAAITNRGSTNAIYLDGNLELTWTAAAESNLAALRFGQNKATTGTFAGQLGRGGLPLWARALTPADVRKLVAAPHALRTPQRLPRGAGRVAAAGGGPWPWFLDNAMAGGHSPMGL